MPSRRQFLRSGAASSLALLGGRWFATSANHDEPAAGGPRRLDAAREILLHASATAWDVGDGRTVTAWTYNGTIPGPEIRVRQGDLVRVILRNGLPEPTTIHWHGLPVPFSMDGVPGLTQPAVGPGESFTYEFVAEIPGTYWFHSHFASQFERGLFGALVVEPKAETLVYDVEQVIVLDDWLHDPDHPVAAELPHNFAVAGTAMGSMAMAGMDLAQMIRGMGGMAGGTVAPAGTFPPGHGRPSPEPVFQAHTVNGRRGDALPPIRVRRGQRVRLRLINAATATVYPLYLAGHRLTVTHLDGQPVSPFDTDVVVVGMGERVDVLFDAGNPGVWRFGSVDPAQREAGLALTVLYDGVRPAAPESATPPVVPPLPYQGVRGPARGPASPTPSDRAFELSLRMSSPTAWTINGKAYPDHEPLDCAPGERIRVTFQNNSPFAHPMHLHGHCFDVVRPYGAAEDREHPIRKDTLTLYHMDRHVVEFTADNPGPAWLLHCHNQYHHAGGMATLLRYR